MSDRVVVTGLSAITPFGRGVDVFWDGVLSGSNAISKINSFDTTGFNRDFGGEIPDYNPTDDLPRTSRLALDAAEMACDDAGIKDILGDLRVAVSFGTTMGNQSIVESHNSGKACNPADYAMANIPASINHALDLNGPVMLFPTACSAGNYAIMWGYNLIKSGRADIVIAGGSDAMSRGCYSIFNRLNAIAKDYCRPFDKNRSGMIVSEGVGCLILERESLARKRKARICAEMLGYGMGADAHHSTAPHPEGEGIITAIKSVLAQIGERSVSYISAHGTGTRANDATESKALRELFGIEGINQIPVSSIKSIIGHTMGGASAIEAIACIKTIMHDVLPPTINYETVDPDCITNVVPNKPQAHPVDTVINIGVGFGGNVAVTSFGKLI